MVEFDVDGGLFRFNNFSCLIWAVVTFFSAIVSGYSAKYLQGFKHRGRFIALMLGFTFSVMLFVASEHIGLLLLSWFAMGYFMANLIGADRDWGEAKEAAKYAQKWFLGSAILLSAGMLTIAYQADQYTVSGIIATAKQLPQQVLLPATLFGKRFSR